PAGRADGRLPDRRARLPEPRGLEATSRRPRRGGPDVPARAALRRPPGSRGGWKRLVGALGEAGRIFPLALISVSRPAAGEHRYWGLWLRLWPGGEKRLLAHAGFHGQWLEGLAWFSLSSHRAWN